MSEMKLIMENFRRFSEQNTCTGGTCVIQTPPETAASLTAQIEKLKKYISQAKAKKMPQAISYYEKTLAATEKKLAALQGGQVKEQTGETGPDPLGLRGFGNIMEIPGFKAFEGESMENNQKTYRYRFANLKSARTGKRYTEMAATKSQENKKMLASKKISLVSAEIVERPDLAGFGIAINQPKELKVTWNVGRAAKDEAPAAAPMAMKK